MHTKFWNHMRNLELVSGHKKIEMFIVSQIAVYFAIHLHEARKHFISHPCFVNGIHFFEF